MKGIIKKKKKRRTSKLKPKLTKTKHKHNSVSRNGFSTVREFPQSQKYMYIYYIKIFKIKKALGLLLSENKW